MFRSFAATLLPTSPKPENQKKKAMMPKPSSPRKLPGALAVFACLALSGSVANANPFAFALTNSGAAGVSFRLNEAADSVVLVTRAAGGAYVTNNLGATPAGLTVSSVATDPALPFHVIVHKPGLSVLSQVGTNIAVNSPRGVAVNTRPGPNFGTVYLANSAAGTLPDGISIYYADQTRLATGKSGGYNFATGGSAAPMRISVMPNDDLLIGDWSDAAGNLIGTDPQVDSFYYALQQLTGTAAVPVGTANNHGSVYGGAARGSIATGDLVLYVFDEDYQQDPTSTAANQMNSIWQFNVGAGPLPWGNPPEKLLAIPSIQFVSQNGDLALGPDGKVYMNQRRANASADVWTPSLMVIDPAVYIDPTNYAAVYDPTNLPGVPNPQLGGAYTLTTNYFWGTGTGNARGSVSGGFVWESQSASRDLGIGTLDLAGELNGIAVSPDGNYLAGIQYGPYGGLDANTVHLYPLTNGIPDLSRRLTFGTGSATAAGRGIAWDAANNLYVCSSGGAYLKIYSLGFPTTTTTSSDGTFNAVFPGEVWVTAPDNLASESGDGALFRIHRGGNTSGALTVDYTLSGTAANGSDYNLSGSATLADGAQSVDVPVAAVNDTESELAETVILTIAASTNYISLTGKSATATILDNDPTQLVLEPVYTNMYERVYDDFTQFRIVRLGNTNTPAFAVNFEFSGDAQQLVDFNPPFTQFMDPGVASLLVSATPLDNQAYTGRRSFTIKLAPAAAGEYTLGAQNSVTAFIYDDELPAEEVIFSEGFENTLATNTTPANWKAFFIAPTSVQDFSYTFGYDYAVDGIGAAPGQGTTRGLKATVNKFDTNAQAAALNFYPTGLQPFTNNYALRFSMLLMANSTAGQTEHAVFGVNHSGDKTNWWRSGASTLNGNNQDGLWFSVNTVGGNSRDFALHTIGTTATGPAVLVDRTSASMSQYFKVPPYFALGAPGFNQNASSVVPTWVDVEVASTPNMVQLRMNGAVLIQAPHTTPFQSGNVMIGYNDAFDSIGSVGGAVYYDNLRVVKINAPVITTQPVSASAPLGGSATFTAAANSSAGPVTYQWYRNGVAIPGATSATLQLTGIQAGDYGDYTVVVFDGMYPISSAVATLTAEVVVQPQITVSLSGTTLTLSFDTASAADYNVMYKTQLSDASWSLLQSVTGTGAPASVNDTVNPASSRFYRVEVVQ